MDLAKNGQSLRRATNASARSTCQITNADGLWGVRGRRAWSTSGGRSGGRLCSDRAPWRQGTDSKGLKQASHGNGWSPIRARYCTSTSKAATILYEAYSRISELWISSLHTVTIKIQLEPQSIPSQCSERCRLGTSTCSVNSHCELAMFDGARSLVRCVQHRLGLPPAQNGLPVWRRSNQKRASILHGVCHGTAT